MSTEMVVVDNDMEKEAENTNNTQHTISSYYCCGENVLLWSRESPNKMYILLYNFMLPFIVTSTVGFLAHFTELAFVFPSLGPTAFLHFAVPNKPPASPRNTLIGHLIGIFAGSLSLQVTNLYGHDTAFKEGVGVERIVCASLSVALTCNLMVLLKASHPPAAATTLIVSLGILKTPVQLTVMMTAVLVLTVGAFVLNRLLRKDVIYPVWSVSENNSVDTSATNSAILENEMKDLRMDNFMDCFQLCVEIENDKIMLELIQFAARHKDSLNTLDNYEKIIPYAARVAIECGHIPPPITTSSSQDTNS